MRREGKRREREENEKEWDPKARAPLMYVSSLLLGYLKLCSRGASAVRASDQ
jgi:hypothetical protein